MFARARRGLPSALGRLTAATALAATLLVTAAEPAAAHAIDSGAMPAPPWLLAYLGVFGVLATALALRVRYPRTRHLVPVTDPLPGGSDEVDDAPAAVPSADRDAPRVGPGNVIGVVLLALVLAAALIGPNAGAANIAPVAVLVVWWVGLPMLSLLIGDVMRVVNPFVAVVRVVERLGGDRRVPAEPPPTWVPAAFLAAFAWFFMAYYRPGSPRAVAALVSIYTVAAIAAGLRWGSRWLATGEGFGALSAAVSSIAPIRRSPAPAGTAALMVVWIGSTAFDGFAGTPFWEDVVAGRFGWGRTGVSTIGYVWMIALVGALYLGALRLGQHSGRVSPEAIGVALVPIGVAWFIGHDITLLLFEGQNFIALLSDPIGRGWDLLGTISQTVDYGLAQATWVPWVQVLVVLGGHLAAAVVAHDRALQLEPRQAAVATSLGLAGATAVSVAAAALLVLG